MKAVLRSMLVLPVLCASAIAQDTEGLQAALRRIPIQVPGLYFDSMLPSGDTITANFTVPPNPPPARQPGEIRDYRPPSVRVFLHPSESPEAADKNEKWYVDSTPTGSRKETRNGLTLYVWDQYSYRVLTRVGTTVVDVSSQRSIQKYVLPVLDVVVQQLQPATVRDSPSLPNIAGLTGDMVVCRPWRGIWQTTMLL